jgi:tRNA threonylcarbamoyladenosine biosynthesis protein TsaB
LNTLVIDTSTAIELVAARRAGRTSDLTAPAVLSHSATLFDLIGRALEGVGMKTGDLELLGVGIGPGSFTGIRIALSTARMLAQVLNVPLVGAHSTLFYAASCGVSAGGQVLVAFDAKKGRVFGALYEMAGPGEPPRAIVEPGDYGIEVLAGRAAADCACIGDGVTRHGDELARIVPGHRRIEPPVPSGEAALDIVEALHRANGSTLAGYEHVLPCYTRKSDAEILLELKKRERG